MRQLKCLFVAHFDWLLKMFHYFFVSLFYHFFYHSISFGGNGLPCLIRDSPIESSGFTKVTLI